MMVVLHAVGHVRPEEVVVFEIQHSSRLGKSHS